jgi:hypothetical protein
MGMAATYADKYVNLSKSNWLNTYTAAGIAVQCWAGSIQDFFYSDPDYSGFGPGQITNMEASTSYGKWIENLEFPGDEAHNRGYGLRCYVFAGFMQLPKEVQVELAKSCALCFLPDQITSISNFNNFYALEPIYDQVNIEGFTVNIDGATVYMKRRIQLIVNACKARERGCGDTDMYIAAALAQNGSGFTVFSMKESQLRTLPLARQTKDVKLDWYTWFENGTPKNTSTQLSRFDRAIKELISKNWTVPYIDTNTVNNLINRSSPQ